MKQFRIILLMLLFVLLFYPEYGNTFTCNGDGTVTDAQGLEWMRCSIGQTWEDNTCKGKADIYTYKELPKLTKSFGYAGKSDWRLPTIEELYTVVDCSSGKIMPFADDKTGGNCVGHFNRPTTDQEIFPNTPDEWFWSSSTTGGDAYYVSFNSGGIIFCCKNHDAIVRLVRTKN